MDDEYSLRLRVDTSELTMAAQQAQLMAYNAASTVGVNGLSPIAGMANSTFAQAQNAQYGASGYNPLQASMASPFSPSMAAMSPFQHMGLGNYTSPQGFLAGSPVGPSSYAGISSTLTGTGMNMALRGFANSSLGGALANYFPAMNIPTMGLYGGGGRLDLPVYRAQQMAAERASESVDKLMTGAAKFGIGAAVGAGTLASFGMPLAAGGPLGLAAFALGSTADYGFNVQSKYLEQGEYFKDAMSSTMRDRLGGGATHHQAAQFMRGMGKTVAQDDYLLRDDYNLIIQAGTELGFMQSTQTPDSAVRAVQNIGQSIKAMAAMGTKLVDVQKDMETLRSVGIDLSRNQTDVARYMGTMGFNAFSANMSTGNMMSAAAQASPLFSSMGFAPTVGANIHSQSLAFAGESIRAGKFSIADQAYYGGQEGMANAQTRAISALNKTGLGQVGILGAMLDPSLSGTMLAGGGGINALLNSSAFGMGPTTYSQLMYRMPEFTKEMNPNTFGMGQVASVVNSLKDSLGGKIDYGTLSQILSKMGMSPDDARLMTRQLEDAPDTLRGMKQSMMNKATQTLMETNRPMANILNNPAVFMQKKLEQWFDPMLSGMAAGREDFMGHIEHSIMNTFLGEYIDPTYKSTLKLDKSLVGLAGVDTALAVYGTNPEERKSDMDEIREAGRAETTRKIRNNLTLGASPLGFAVGAGFGSSTLNAELVRNRKSKYKNELTLLDESNLVGSNFYKAGNLGSLPKSTTIKSEAEFLQYVDKMRTQGLSSEEDEALSGYFNTIGLSKESGDEFVKAMNSDVASDTELEGLVNTNIKNSSAYGAFTRGTKKPDSFWNILSTQEPTENYSDMSTKLTTTSTKELQRLADKIESGRAQGADNEELMAAMVNMALGLQTPINKEQLKDMAKHDPQNLTKTGAFWQGVKDRTKGPAKQTIDDVIKYNREMGSVDGANEGFRQVKEQYEGMKQNANSLLRYVGVNGNAEGQDLALIEASVGERIFSAGYQEHAGSAGKDEVDRYAIQEFLKQQKPEDLEAWNASKFDPEARQKFMEDQASKWGTTKQSLLGANPSQQQMDIVRGLSEEGSPNYIGTNYGGKLGGSSEVARKYASTASKLAAANTKEIRDFFKIKGNDALTKMTDALNKGDVTPEEFSALLKNISTTDASQVAADEKRDVVGVKNLAGLALELPSLGKEGAAAKLQALLENDFSWSEQAGDNAAGESKDTIAKIFGRGQEKNVQAVTASLISMSQKKEQFTDRLMMDPSGKGGYLNKEQLQGISQATQAINQQAEIVRVISDSIDRVPKSLDKFREDFKKEFVDGRKATDEKLISVLNKIDGKLLSSPAGTLQK